MKRQICRTDITQLLNSDIENLPLPESDLSAREVISQLYDFLMQLMLDYHYHYSDLAKLLESRCKLSLHQRTLQRYLREEGKLRQTTTDITSKQVKRSPVKPQIASTQTPLTVSTPIASESITPTPIAPLETTPVLTADMLLSAEIESVLETLPDYRDQAGVDRFLAALRQIKPIDPNRWRLLMGAARNADINVTGTIAPLPSTISAMFNKY